MSSSVFIMRVGMALLELAYATGCATAVAQSLQCSVGSQPARLGQDFTWTITGRDLAQPLPTFTPAQFAPDWLLQGQQESSSGDASGHSDQSATLVLYPLRAGALALPAVAVGGQQCPVQTVKVVDHAQGEAPLQWRTRFAPARPYQMQQMRVELRVIGGGNLVWTTPQPRSPQALLTPLAPDSRTETVDGKPQQVQVFAWSALPLKAGEIDVEFGLLRAYAFGQLRVYAPPALTFEAQALPQWWPAEGLIGKPQVQTLQASRQLRLGETGEWRLRLQGAGVDRAQVLRVFDAWRAQPQPGLEIAGVEVRRGSEGPDELGLTGGAWEVRVFFRPLRAGTLKSAALRLDYFDPRTALPAVAWWSPPVTTVNDPRPVHLAQGLGGALALLGLLFALRATLCCLRRRRALRLALARLAAAHSADALRRAWLDLPPGREQRPAPTLDAWLLAAAMQDDATLRGAALALQHQLYTASGEQVSKNNTTAPAHAAVLAERLQQSLTACGWWLRR
ncbi:BatD family protein [Thiomonas sp. FB-Cd]|uniref:Protein BatD n=1 Tax=mine drainage metagenome TaxID=410659 RepID=E6PNZ4_9ZZZZ|nr:BatD family protein [Thiomonas sp. FB-Cd]